MARIKTGSLKQHEKVLTLMFSGNPIEVKEIKTLLSKEIQLYRISAYMLYIKLDYKATIKTQKNGRNVVSYQLMNAEEIKKVFETRHPNYAKQKAKEEIAPINKLSDLKEQTEKPKKQKKEKVKEELSVEEITE